VEEANQLDQVRELPQQDLQDWIQTALAQSMQAPADAQPLDITDIA
jgi:hypothetical protein